MCEWGKLHASTMKEMKKARKRIKPLATQSPLMLMSSCSIVPDARRLRSCRQSRGEKLLLVRWERHRAITPTVFVFNKRK